MDTQFYSPEVAYGNGRYVFVGEFDVFAGTSSISPGGGSNGGNTGGGVASYAGTYTGKIGSRVNGVVNDALNDYSVVITPTGNVTANIGGVASSLTGTINAALHAIAARAGTFADAVVTVAIPGGEELAKRTANPRLGIAGGLSILGTTGIVIPYSCSSWIHSFHRGIDVARAAGVAHIAASTGSTSEAAAQRLYKLPEVALIDMGDFVGGTLKYLRRHPVPRLTLAGGFGKLAKLAAGHLDLHSSRSRGDTALLAEILASAGASSPAVGEAAQAGSAGEALAALAPADADILARGVAARAREVALATLAGGIAVDVAVFDRQGSLLAHVGS